MLIAAALGLSAVFPRQLKPLAIICFTLGVLSLVLAGVANYGALSEVAEVSGITTLAAGATGLALRVLDATFYRAHQNATENSAE